ncbi:hypothetical protein [Methylocystis borbori]|uniref:hypothetical protein n=1 Tax=Methylocystis borbori TaxID=3118750 RepID=UPI002F964F26
MRSKIRWPEEEHHQGPVELVCNIGSTLYALEHTCIEPFEGLIKLNQEAERVFGPIEMAVSVVVPDGEVWNLSLPALGLQGKSGREIRQAQKALIEFIKSTAPTLPLLPYADYRKGPPPFNIANVPFPVTLHRFRSEVPSTVPGFKRLMISHVVAGNEETREAQRQKRIEKACNARRFDKLAVWKTRMGARTVLILENTDLFLTNEEIAAHNYLDIVANCSNSPDEAYLFETGLNSRWYLWPLQIGKQTFFDIYSDAKQPFGEFIPSELVSATNR